MLNAVLKKVDFVKLMERVAKIEPEAGFKSFGGQCNAFTNQEEIKELAIDLAYLSLKENGDDVTRNEIKAQADIISCNYDPKLHKMLRVACFNVVTSLFQSENYNRIFVSEDERELKELANLKKAQENGNGVIYLINHSSHWDEFVVNIFLDQNDLGLPLFAAGQNMMFSPSLTKVFMIGSYVILRRGTSRTYLSTLFHYCQALGEMSKAQGIFLEAWSGGARTRDGSLRYPKRLITLQGALEARNNAYVQPIIVNYSLVPEDLELSEGYGLKSWLNGHKIGRNLLMQPWAPIKATLKGLKNIYGRTYVSLGEGKYVSELKEASKESSDLILDEYVSLEAIKNIAKHKKIMASHVAAAVFKRAKTKSALIGTAEKVVDEINDYHLKTFGVEPDYEDFFKNHSLAEVLEDGLKSLRKRKIFHHDLKFNDKLPKVKANHTLSYYATHSDRRLYSPSAKENIVVCGAGPWGYSVVNYLGKRLLTEKRFSNSSLTLYDHRDDRIQSLVYDRTLKDFFPEHRLSKNIFPTTDHQAAFRKATEVIVATPPNRVDEALKTIFSTTKNLETLIIASRGFDRQSHRLTLQMAWEAAVAYGSPQTNILALSGSVSAKDLLFNTGGRWILAGEISKGRQSEIKLFENKNFIVELSDDPIGVQVAAALADAFTLYAACLYNTDDFKKPSSLASFVQSISRETKSLALALGGKASTFEADNPAWVPELLVTSLSAAKLDSVKIALIKGSKGLLEYIKRHDGQELLWPDTAVTGYHTIRSAYLTSKHLGLQLNYLEKAYQMFWGT